MRHLQLVIVVLVGLANALPRLVKRDSSSFAYELPSNASAIVGPIVTGFDCSNRSYGYYADPANGCAIFHVCYPYVDPEGNFNMRMFSLLCGEGTIFDQSTLTCNFPEYALPCDAAASLYNINDYFGRDDRQFRDGLNGIF
ncbi:U-scoloptoxin(01)-Cw1a-like [Homarus americanus]|nr:U-scoloptoxin(01)-Cw1a-like [Homarus americanus]